MKRIITLILAFAILFSAGVIGATTASASGSGAGLTNWAYRAYNEGWSYVWGGTSVGAVDCSGLIYSYAGGARVTEDMIAASPESGSMDSIPRIHGLGLYQYGHVGVYVGNGMGIDARDEISNVCLDSVYNKSWDCWFKISGVSYPSTGWEEVAGNYYYYENGQYVVNTTRDIDGVTYSFGSDGISNQTPGDTSSTATQSVSKKKHKAKKTAWMIGDSGDQVTKIQERLKELGFYHDEITGYFGEKTQKAYKAFQKAAGVDIDGICGQSDRDILYSSAAPYAEVEEEKSEDKKEETKKKAPKEQVMSVGDYSDDVYSVQTRLIELKYMNDDATGYFGEITQTAVSDFQAYNEIESTGEVDKITKTALFADDAIPNPEAKEEEEEKASFTFKKTETTEEKNSAEEAAVEEATSTTVVLDSDNMASEALADLASDSSFQSVTPNSEEGAGLIKWLVIVIAVMGCVFAVVLINERKKAKRRRRKHAMHSSRRYW